jgi:hypothetical protein
VHSNTGCFRRELLPPARHFYEHELGKLSRPSRGWVRGRCPFHESKSGLSFSVNLDSGGFYCFGCEAKGGDVVAFVRLRDRCDFKTACQSLGVWHANVTADERVKITRLQQEREWHREREAEQKKNERRARLDLRNELHTAVKLYRRVDGELHRLGPEAEDHWSALPPLLDDWRLSEAAYCVVARLENPYE